MIHAPSAGGVSAFILEPGLARLTQLTVNKRDLWIIKPAVSSTEENVSVYHVELAGSQEVSLTPQPAGCVSNFDSKNTPAIHLKKHLGLNVSIERWIFTALFNSDEWSCLTSSAIRHKFEDFGHCSIYLRLYCYQSGIYRRNIKANIATLSTNTYAHNNLQFFCFLSV